MKVNRINSILFHTENLSAVRHFYSEVLGLTVGTYEKNGQKIPDESETYVNSTIGETLLCFEAR